jgi:hypothetical protein
MGRPEGAQEIPLTQLTESSRKRARSRIEPAPSPADDHISQILARIKSAEMWHPHGEAPLKTRYGYEPAALRSFELHWRRAEDHGDSWSDEHAYAMLQLHHAYALTAKGVQRGGQTAWPFGLGVGKTQSLVARVLDQSQQRVPQSILICVETIRQATNAYRDMVVAGVPPGMVGVYHTKTRAEVAREGLQPSIADDQIPTTPFLIVSHAMMLEGNASIDWVNRFGPDSCKGSVPLAEAVNYRARDLIVWDESLIKSDGGAFNLAEIEVAAAALRATLRDVRVFAKEDVIEALNWVDQVLATLRTDFEAQNVNQGSVTLAEAVNVRTLPQLTREHRRRLRTALVTPLGREGDISTKSREQLVGFIEHAPGREVRVISVLDGVNQRQVGMIHIRTLIPRDIPRLIVLDASHIIRRLVNRHDPDIRQTTVNCAVKSFQDVTVRHVVRGAGKRSLPKELVRNDSEVTKLLLDAIRAHPADEAQLIVTFKQSDRDARRAKLSDARQLKDRMEFAGIDHNEKLADRKPRFEFITWGQHVGVSSFARCTHVLLVGVLRLPELDVAALIAAQQGDLATKDANDGEEIKTTLLSEMFYHVTQAGGRGRCRTTRQGLAGAMKLTLLCSEVFPADWWQSAMPGVQIVLEEPSKMERMMKLGERHRAVLKVFAGLHSNENYISTKTVKKLAGLAHMNPAVFSRMMSELRETILRCCAFVKDGRGYARTEKTAGDYGFEPDAE